ncbi:carboxypeptidase-like regulatory domain-containing protein, partial [Candidatus Woesearchaeota archaeon]|nr:carboxypeptidase-like regulatory domain-containing protein [Candidatus Woesearchaeota archaeon]
MEKRAIVAKILALVSFLIVSLLSIPFASAAPLDFKILDQTIGQLHKILGMDAVVFGILVFLLFFLLYGIFALGLSRSRLGGDNGRLNKNGKIIALSLAGVIIVSTFFVRKNVLAFAKNRLAPQFNLFFAVILSVLMFMLFRWLGQQTFRDREDMANVFGIFAVGLALSMFGAIGNARWAEGIGLTLIIISAIWLLVLLISGAGGPDDERRRPPTPPPPPPPPPPGRATIWGVVVDAATGNSLGRGVQVTATVNGAQVANTTTNNEGHYRLYSMEQSDNVIVHARTDGYDDWDSEAINLTEDRRLDIPMTPEAPPHHVYNIRVQVLDQDVVPHAPIQNDDTRFFYSTPHDPMPHEIPDEHVHPQGNGVYILDIIYAGGAPPPPPIPGIVGATCPGYHPNPAAVNIPDITHPAHQYEILMTAGGPPPPPPPNAVNVEVVDAGGTRIINPATRLR